ncbi:FkbM family methyltransferase [Taklimakanibacter lacteus]|uniref:FkbM family methyltransferase n=1 Tax=Taklimakanibacter lacteus TaxID=2268456 RepID=UPI000E66BA38
MNVLDITYHGETVTLADLPEYRKFYGKLTSGVWEPKTFRTLSDQLSPDITYIDIGGWIGVTPFWASRRARRVIVVEPDPKCHAVLKALLPRYPNVSLTECALSPKSCLTLNAVDDFGSSETSALDIGNKGCSVEVPGCSMGELLKKAGPGPVFVKIDIEGYEYKIADELRALDRAQVRGVQLAVHPALYEKSLAGLAPFRRGRTLLATLRLARLYRELERVAAVGKFSSLVTYLISGVGLTRSPRGADILFLNRTPPLQCRGPDHTLGGRKPLPSESGPAERDKAS